MQKRKKNILSTAVVLCCLVVLSATPGVAQQALHPDDAMQAFTSAIQQGNVPAAAEIYQNIQKGKAAAAAAATEPTTSAPAALPEGSPPSLFESMLPGNLRQFGYDLFNRTVSSFAPPSTLAVGPDYIIGPGDEFTLTLWGTTEGIYNLRVTREGEVTLPKVGVITVNGVRFGELERTLKRHLSRYYRDLNLSVAMGGLKTLSVYVVGEVTKPGSYSLSSLATVYGALFAAGGPTKQGTLRTVQVLRAGKVVRTLDLYEFLMKGDRSQDIKLQNEDTVFVPLIGPIAGISGAVYRPAIYELRGKESIDDVIRMAGGIMPTALGGRLQLTRYSDNQRKVMLDIRIEDRGQAGGGAPAQAFPEQVLNMDAISIGSVYDKVWETVSVSGEVQHPGDVQWRPDLRIKEVIAEAGLLPTSDLTKAEIIRLNKNMTDREILPVDLAALLKGDASQNMALEPKDQVRVYTLFKGAEKVAVSGEVLRPGTYEIMKGERLSDVLKRAGGITAQGYAYGAVFKRQNVKVSENRNLQSYTAKMQKQMLMIAAGSAASTVNTEESVAVKTELTINQSLLESLKAMQAQNEGRVAINITANVDQWAGSTEDIVLQDGDSLFIPKRPQEVLVVGEVYSPGAQIFAPEMSVQDYLDRSGGATKYADADMTFVMQANGYAYGADSPAVGDVAKSKLQAGDAVFVPQKMERYYTMRTTKDIVDILFKTAVVIATITILF